MVTAHDWDQLDHADGNRFEVIGGHFYASTMPLTIHQWVIGSLFGVVGTPANVLRSAYAFPLRLAVFMPGCDPVQPDFVLIMKDRADAEGLIRERGLYGVPDVIVEVLSPGTASYDEDVKLRAYANAAVPEYAVIDLDKRTLRYRRLVSEGVYGNVVVKTAMEPFAFACLPQFAFTVGDLFAGMPLVD
jgi:Uma2 family endonuclease